MSNKSVVENKYGVYVAGPSAESAQALDNLINDILYSPAGDAVKIAAIEVVKQSFSNNLSISTCNFSS